MVGSGVCRIAAVVLFLFACALPTGKLAIRDSWESYISCLGREEVKAYLSELAKDVEGRMLRHGVMALTGDVEVEFTITADRKLGLFSVIRQHGGSPKSFKATLEEADPFPVFTESTRCLVGQPLGAIYRRWASHGYVHVEVRFQRVSGNPVGQAL